MKTAIVAVAVAICCVAFAQPGGKINCFDPKAVVHGTETFEECIKICKDNNNFQGEITPAIYECMLDHFEGVDAQGNVDPAVLKSKIRAVAVPAVRQRFIDVLDNTCTQTKVKELAVCLDGQLEATCKDGE